MPDRLRDPWIADDKIQDYLLNRDHPRGGSKAAFFIERGFSRESPESFRSALVDLAVSNDVAGTEHTAYGVKYTVEDAMDCPDGSTVYLMTVWVVELGSERPRLVTAYPSRKR